MKITILSDRKEIWNDGHYHFFPGRIIKDHMPLWVRSDWRRSESWVAGWEAAKREYKERTMEKPLIPINEKRPLPVWQQVQVIFWSALKKREKVLPTHPKLFKEMDSWYQVLTTLKEMNQQ